ncbi:GTP-binding protein Rhes-like protein [Leptotrombidium deliense]|uniref:GTP-binding protein Rhes-like protein n=1 Tax=Leptotrombidium deliense TaxID=299467 RepID=A0A443SIR3_9ACAR|nr:GTP-binding protein Rhes-like protein [Leptotrombidium deliense]
MPGLNLASLPHVISVVSVTDQKVRLHTRIVILGPSKVGKTAIVQQFLYGTFPETYNETVDELHRTQFKVSSLGTLTLDILDTSGSSEFPAMRRLAIESADAFVLVFDVNDYSSFEEIRCLRELILQIKGTKLPKSSSAADDKSQPVQPPIVVVGNKNDTCNERAVCREVVETITTIDWENGYIDCSAKQGVNVCKVFQELMAQAKVPADISVAIGKETAARRKSLPAYPSTPKLKSSTAPKRHSCALS